MQSRSAATIDTKYQHYLITISCQQKKDYIFQALLDEVLLWLKISIDDLHIVQYIYENSGKYKQLHWHGLARLPIGFRYAPYTTFGDKDITGNTYIIHWKKVKYLLGASKYLNKDLKHQSQDDILINNYFSINRFNEKYLD